MLQKINPAEERQWAKNIQPNTFCFLEESEYSNLTNAEFVELLKTKQFYNIKEETIDISLLEKKILLNHPDTRAICLDYFDVLWEYNSSSLIKILSNVNSPVEPLYSKYLLKGVTKLEGASDVLGFWLGEDKKFELKPIHNTFESNIFSEFAYDYYMPAKVGEKNDEPKNLAKLLNNLSKYVSELDETSAENFTMLSKVVKDFIHISYKKFPAIEFYTLAHTCFKKFLSIYEKELLIYKSPSAQKEVYNILNTLFLPMLPFLYSQEACLRENKSEEKIQLMNYIEQEFASKLAALYLQRNINESEQKANIEKFKTIFEEHVTSKKEHKQDINKGLLSNSFISLANNFYKNSDTIYSKIYDCYCAEIAKMNTFYFKCNYQTNINDNLSEINTIEHLNPKLRFLLKFKKTFTLEKELNSYGNNVAHLLFLSMPLGGKRNVDMEQEKKIFKEIKEYLTQTSSWGLLKEKNQKGLTPLDILNKRQYFSFNSASYTLIYGDINKERSSNFEEFSSLMDKSLLTLEIKQIDTIELIKVDKNNKI